MRDTGVRLHPQRWPERFRAIRGFSGAPFRPPFSHSCNLGQEGYILWSSSICIR